ncbi:MAG TPA: four-carbon acid sugar kinase family protein [Chryseolinea sp.]
MINKDKLLVLADDFSGAAEIGGIAHRYGLTTEIQLSLDTGTSADVVVFDTNTRSLSESEAVKKSLEIAAQLKDIDKPFNLFKKIDSVLRGHLVAELSVLQQCLNFRRILLMPGNPTRGRKIVGGEYFVHGIKLHDTVFSTDPDFPISSSFIADRLNTADPALHHVHIGQHDPIPTSGIVTGDIESKDDLKNYVAGTDANDLCCGAAELFETYVEHLGFKEKESDRQNVENDFEFTMIVNGSTVRSASEKAWLVNSNIPIHPCPGEFEGREFLLHDDAVLTWFQEILTSLHLHKVAAVIIDHPIQHNKSLSEKFLHYFVALMDYINTNIPLDRIHWYLTGGATASALIRSLNVDRLAVMKEVAPGVVSLMLPTQSSKLGCVTVKPGSYEWPTILRNCTKRHN